MSTESNSARSVDPGLDALVGLLHFQGIAADREQIRHRLGAYKIGAPEILRCAKELGLKARALRTSSFGPCSSDESVYPSSGHASRLPRPPAGYTFVCVSDTAGTERP